MPDAALSEEEAAEWMMGGEWELFLWGLQAKGWDTSSRVLLSADAWRAEWGLGLDNDDVKTD